MDSSNVHQTQALADEENLIRENSAVRWIRQRYTLKGIWFWYHTIELEKSTQTYLKALSHANEITPFLSHWEQTQMFADITQSVRTPAPHWAAGRVAELWHMCRVFVWIKTLSARDKRWEQPEGCQSGGFFFLQICYEGIDFIISLILKQHIKVQHFSAALLLFFHVLWLKLVSDNCNN